MLESFDCRANLLLNEEGQVHDNKQNSKVSIGYNQNSMRGKADISCKAEVAVNHCPVSVRLV